MALLSSEWVDISRKGRSQPGILLGVLPLGRHLTRQNPILCVNDYRTAAPRSIEQRSDEISPAPRFRPIAIADVVQVCRRTISGFRGRRPELSDSQTLDFADLRIFDENGIGAKGLAHNQRAITAPDLGAFHER
jgi:hypothetical protein